MTIACAGPDPSLGVAVRLADYLDCQGRALGENGFQALAGGPVASGLLSGLVTIFVALIGYRLILGRTPGLGDGIGWAARLGLVLALVTGWPAFQTLVYRVAVEAPGQIAQLVLPAAGLPSEDLDARIQQAYDTIRLGSAPGQGRKAEAAAALPQTASAFVIATAGVTGAFRIAVGLLLAVAPLAILAALFDATLGLFDGWLRALAGAALGGFAAMAVTAVHLVAVEGELARVQDLAVDAQADADPQAVTTVVLLFAVVMLVAVVAAMRMAGAFRLPIRSQPIAADPVRHAAQRGYAGLAEPAFPRGGVAAGGPRSADTPDRAAVVADALAATVRRERGAAGGAAPEPPSRGMVVVQAARDEASGRSQALGVAGRRSALRRTPSAARRDRTA